MRFNSPTWSSFIVALKRGPGFPITDVIPFQFMPKTITDAKSASYRDIVIIGRSSPIKSYEASTARKVSFTLDFFAAPEAGLGFVHPILLKTRIDALKALVYPVYKNFRVLPPPRCLVYIGLQLAIVGVCKDVSVSYDANTPWTVKGPLSLAFGASVSLTFEEALNIPLSNFEVKLGLPISIAGNEFTGQLRSSTPAGFVDVSTAIKF